MRATFMMPQVACWLKYYSFHLSPASKFTLAALLCRSEPLNFTSARRGPPRAQPCLLVAAYRSQPHDSELHLAYCRSLIIRICCFNYVYLPLYVVSSGAFHQDHQDGQVSTDPTLT